MSRKPHQRSAARARAFQTLYSLHFSPVASVGELRRAFLATPDPDLEPGEETSGPDDLQSPGGFAWELVEGVWSRRSELDEVIGRFSQNWRVDRLGKIELTLLRLAMFELLHRSDVPARVAINEALELTARFGDAKAKSFINGILDSAARTLIPASGNPVQTDSAPSKRILS